MAGGRPAVGPGQTGEHGGGHLAPWEAHSLAHTFQEKLLRLGGLARWPRRAVLLALGAMVLASVLLAAGALPGPQVPISTQGESIPALAFAGCLLLLTLAWGYLLAGSLHSHWPVRLLVLGLYTGSLGLLALISAGNPPAGDDTTYVLLHTLPPFALVGGALFDLWLLLGVTSLLRGGVRAAGGPDPLRFRTLLSCLAFTALLFGLAYGGAGTLSPKGLAFIVGFQLLSLQLFLLMPVLFLTGTDFAEWSEVLAGRSVSALSGLPAPVLPLVAIAASLAVLGDALRVSGGFRQLWWQQLLPAAGFGVLAVLLGMLLLPRAPRLHVSLGPLLGTGLVAFLLAVLYHAPAAPVVGLVLLAMVVAVTCGGAWPTLAVPAFLFCLVMVLMVLNSVHLSGGPRAIFDPGDLRAAAAALCLVVAVVALVRDRPGRDLPLVRLALVLVGGLQVLYWLLLLFQVTSAGAGRFSLVQALLVLLGLLWDVAMSGEAVTNVHGRRVPRHSRILLYFGYELLVATAILWDGTAKGGVQPFDTDFWVSTGLRLMGTPLLVVFFAFGVLRWWRGRRIAGFETIEREDALVR